MLRRDILRLFGLAAAAAATGEAQEKPAARTPDQQLAEMEKRLRPMLDESARMAPDPSFSPMLKAAHEKLTKLLNEGEKKEDHIEIPMPRVFVTQTQEAIMKTMVLPDKSYVIRRSANLDELLSPEERESLLARQLVHIARKVDSKRANAKLALFLGGEQANAFLTQRENGNDAKAKSWAAELLADGGARAAECNTAVYEAIDKVHGYNAYLRKEALGDLYEPYTKLTPEARDAIASNIKGARAEPEGKYPPMSLRMKGRDPQKAGFCKQ